MNCHNGEEYLKEAIDSIYKQTFQAWEIIFFDNCSTDSTPYIASQYATLGTDGYGRSDSRETLRDFFEVNAKSIARSSIYLLYQEDFLSKDEVDQIDKQNNKAEDEVEEDEENFLAPKIQIHVELLADNSSDSA